MHRNVRFSNRPVGVKAGFQTIHQCSVDVARGLVFLFGNGTNASSMLEIGEVKTAASALGIEIVPLDIQRAEDIAPALDAFSGRAEALSMSQPIH